MISILLQARMSSSRLPGKVMREINGKPMLDYLLERVKKCKKVQDIILIIPDGKEDDVLETWCIKSGVDYYRGNEDNLLERFYKAAIKFNVSTIVRLTGDNPLIDSELIDQVIELYSSSNYDFVSNAVPLPTSYPIGMSVEVFGLSCFLELVNSKEVVKTKLVSFNSCFSANSMSSKGIRGCTFISSTQ